jgi:hypothetical protein
MTQTNKEKQESFRARRAMMGLTEVRGLYLPPEMHKALRETAHEMLSALTDVKTDKGLSK